MPIVLCNASPLITLGKLNRLELLADLYSEVRITPIVYKEVVTQGLARGAPDALTVRLFWQRHGWPVVEVPSAVLEAYTPSMLLHPGERELLALAQTQTNPLMLLDDEVARAEARRLQLPVRGTLGVLVQAYRAQLLALIHVELLIQEIAVRPDIWVSAKLCEQVLAALRSQ
jgi:predicted nucleic acid-binding protein